MAGSLGVCLARYAATKELPEQPWLRAKVQWHVDIARAMNSTVPPPSDPDPGAENS
jgi:hypothetical protein